MDWSNEDCLKKIKDSTKTGAGSEEIYKPSWFAFDAIHSYMGAVYDYRPTVCTEIRESEQKEERSQSLENYSEESNTESPLFYTSNTERPLSRDSISQSESDPFSISKRKRGVQDWLIAKKQMDKAFTIIKNRSNRKENEKQLNKCDLYGQLVSEKLKHLHEDDRLGLMNEIDNLLFKYIMNVKKRNRSRTTYLPSTQFAVNNQPVVTSQGDLYNTQSLLNYESMESHLLPQQNALNKQ
ncbi:unnamed protein product [Parnassius apollo]|uniref:(apollo) hypothetical protein n=1 Tax=Parnassius apollo TaxID=110799 RepID=A0A8S3YCK0_PARAO|nr:unnamed protein product [Parnassius apollo]